MNLVFDLDGTLTDPELGITRCITYALDQLGRPAPEPSALRRFIGPPLRDVFWELLSTSEPMPIERAVALYRQRFGEAGLYENRPYPATAAALERLAGNAQWARPTPPRRATCSRGPWPSLGRG